MAKQTRGVFRAYFFKDHDPVLDAVDRVYELAGMLNFKGIPRYEKIAELCGDVTAGTLRDWRNRKTKRPQSAKIEGVLRGLGAQRAVLFQGRIVTYGDKRPRLSIVSNGKRKAA